MHEYPTIMPRALRLKSVVTLGKDSTISGAVKFPCSAGFDPAVFCIPSGFRIENQM